ncbi:MAG: hypothetical protein MRY72_08290 [Aquisalinus sp.]|nr:hypothetical protein [Aquisalinus sp.]
MTVNELAHLVARELLEIEEMERAKLAELRIVIEKRPVRREDNVIYVEWLGGDG